jgi:hypothetical protein
MPIALQNTGEIFINRMKMIGWVLIAAVFMWIWRGLRG